MAHFAHITNGIVDKVIVIDGATLATGAWGDPSEWVQTSYNVCKGEYKGDEIVKTALLAKKEMAVLSLNTEETKRVGDEDDMKARTRMHYAGIGYSYDAKKDRFIPPMLKEGSTLNETTCTWEHPDDPQQDPTLLETIEELKASIK